MLISIWQALNPFNGNAYELTDAQRVTELRCVLVLLLLFAAVFAVALIKVLQKRKNGDKK